MRSWREDYPGIALPVARVYVSQFLTETGLTRLSYAFLAGSALLPQLQQFAAHTPHG